MLAVLEKDPAESIHHDAGSEIAGVGIPIARRIRLQAIQQARQVLLRSIVDSLVVELLDVSLIDGSGRELDMGSPVDGAGPLARHGCTAIAPAAQRNRAILLGLMAAAGWDHYLNEWWHYQLYEPRRYPLLDESAAGTAMM